MELNPNHPMTRHISEHWAKIVAILCHKFGGHVVITTDDIDAAMVCGLNITVRELGDGLHLRIVDSETAKALASANGGLPN